MKFRLLLLFFSLLFSMVLVSCGEEERVVEESKESNMVLDVDYYDFQGFNMLPYDIPVMIMLPDETAKIGASTKPEVIHEDDDFKWELLVGSNFEMLIDDWGDYMDMVVTRKKELESLDFYKINLFDYIGNRKIIGQANTWILMICFDIPKKAPQVFIF